MIKTAKINFDGKEYFIETGRFAKFANGAVMVTCGDTMVLVTAVAADKAMQEVDFLPFQVEYREKTASAGKIPGGFLKREGRPTDKEVLSARLIDRPIRPMLPKSWRFETQIIANVFSADPEVGSDTLATVGASAALLISDIPFAGPVSEVRVGRIDGNFVINPSPELTKQSDIDITVAGTDDAILMVEGECREISEEEFVDALLFAHSRIRELNCLQNALAEQLDIKKREYTEEVIPDDFVETITDAIFTDMSDYVHLVTSKSERSKKRDAIREKALTIAKEKFANVEELAELLEKYSDEVTNKLEKKLMRQMIINENKRLDGRTHKDIRPISCEIGLLPRTHGSALFTRGETQSLTTVTLGTNRDEQMIEGLEPSRTERFLLHYNFPPFSTGEVGRIGTSRREIGHGHLAWRALKDLLPEQENFSYTIRVVSDILESNGSSSMATVCAGTLALFDAGVPLKKPVAGIAMGLIKDDEKVAILSDILGDEDFLGDMDFKVTGTIDGITACQMDIKIAGLSVEIMTEALEQARRGRMHILDVMNQTISSPKDDLSPYAPRYTSIKIPTDMIGAVIGPGGDTIRSITRDTRTEINIEDDGTIMIAATNKTSAESAAKIIEALTQKPKEGEIYLGTVKEIRDGLGAFVEILPKTQGLLHISQIIHERLENMDDVLKVGDKIEVKLLEISKDGKYRLSRKALLPVPEGMELGEGRPPRRDDRRGGGSNDRRSNTRR